MNDILWTMVVGLLSGAAAGLTVLVVYCAYRARHDR